MPPRALTKRLRFPWSSERSLTMLLVTLLLLLLLPGVGEVADALLTLVSTVLLTVLLVSGVLILTRQPTLRLLCWGLVSIAIGVRWLYAAGWAPSLLRLNLVFTIFSLLAIAWVVMLQVSRAGPVTAHHVRGAMGLYLLIAAIFAYAYAFVEVTRPGAFQLPAWWSPELSRRPESFYYFSVVTLTTLGYGDVTAIDPAGRDLVMLEALIGQLYPAIIIARLVTLELQDRHSAARDVGSPESSPRDVAAASLPGRRHRGGGPGAESETRPPTDN